MLARIFESGSTHIMRVSTNDPTLDGSKITNICGTTKLIKSNRPYVTGVIDFNKLVKGEMKCTK